MNNGLGILAGLVTAIVPLTIFIILYGLAFHRRMRFSAVHTFLILSGMMVFHIVLAVVMMRSAAFAQWGYVVIALYFVIDLVFCKIVIRAPITQLAFAFFLIKSYADDVFLFSKILQAYCMPQRFTEVQGFFLSYAIVFNITFPLICLFFSKLLYPLVELQERLPFWSYLWAAPALFYVIYRLGISPDYPSPEAVWNKTDVLLPLAWATGTFFCYTIMLLMLSKVVQVMEYRERLHISEQQIRMQKEQYTLLQTNMETVTRMHHDLRHHFTALSGYVQKKDQEGLETYLHDFGESIGSPPVQYCQNFAVDAIVQHFLHIAQENGIRTQVDLDLPQYLPFPDSDICIILGNLLENALEACLRQSGADRFLTLKAGQSGRNMLAVSVKNSFEGKVLKKGNDFLSSKRSGAGIGITSVRHIAGKYKGIVEIRQKDQVFTARVFLNPSQNHTAASDPTDPATARAASRRR